MRPLVEEVRNAMTKFEEHILEVSIKVLHERISELAMRLAPVRRDMPESIADEASPSLLGSSPVAVGIVQSAALIDGATRYLRAIINSLEV